MILQGALELKNILATEEPQHSNGCRLMVRIRLW